MSFPSRSGVVPALSTRRGPRPGRYTAGTSFPPVGCRGAADPSPALGSAATSP